MLVPLKAISKVDAIVDSISIRPDFGVLIFGVRSSFKNIKGYR